MIQANGETRRWLAFTAAGAVVTAVCTKLGEWAVDAIRKRVSPSPATKSAEGSSS